MTHAAPDPETVEAESAEPDSNHAETKAKKAAHGDSTLGLLEDIAKVGAEAGADPNDAGQLAKLVGKSLMRAVGAIGKGATGTATQIAQDVSAGESITGILDERVEQMRSAAWSALGLEGKAGAPKLKGASFRDLKAHGDALLDSSWNAATQPREEHPAFAQIMSSITADEARILRFLAVSGPQPAMDVRTKTPFGVGSERLAGGINLIADMAGCQWTDRDQHYLANLNRLGLVRFSEEPVEDFRRYSLLTANQAAIDAYAKAKKTIDIYRSIYLSLFGKQFCEACFTLEGYDAGGWSTYDPGDKYIGKGPRVYQKKGH